MNENGVECEYESRERVLERVTSMYVREWAWGWDVDIYLYYIHELLLACILYFHEHVSLSSCMRYVDYEIFLL